MNNLTLKDMSNQANESFLEATNEAMDEKYSEEPWEQRKVRIEQMLNGLFI